MSHIFCWSMNAAPLAVLVHLQVAFQFESSAKQTPQNACRFEPVDRVSCPAGGRGKACKAPDYKIRICGNR